MCFQLVVGSHSLKNLTFHFLVSSNFISLLKKLAPLIFRHPFQVISNFWQGSSDLYAIN